MIYNAAFRYWLLAFALCIAAVIFSVACVDRPVAAAVHASLQQTRVFLGLAHVVDSLAAVVLLALLFLLGAGCWILAGRRFGSWTGIPLLCSWSLVWTISATTVLKRIFGRTWPDTRIDIGNPSYIHDGAYGFHPLHDGLGYESFPSGTTAIAAAIITVLWICVPRYRAVWALSLSLVPIALVLTNSHFVADAIGGEFLGLSIGCMTVRLLRPER